MSEANLYRKTVKFARIDGSQAEVEAVYEDSKTAGSSIGTVVGIHGSPGSHNDFKYIREKLDQFQVRFIGINFPGFKNTEAYERQDFGNEERQNYTLALLNELNISGNVIYVGHSRGCENALMTAVNQEASGLIMLNPIGLRIHKGIRPQWFLHSFEALYGILPQTIGNFFIYQCYKAAGFKIQDGEEAISALRSMNRCAIQKQLEFIEKLNLSKTKLLFIYAGNDFLMEREVMIEALEKYENLQSFEFEKDISDKETEQIISSFNDKKGASVFVAKDTHFQNKSRADLVARAAYQLLLISSSNKNKL